FLSSGGIGDGVVKLGVVVGDGAGASAAVGLDDELIGPRSKCLVFGGSAKEPDLAKLQGLVGESPGVNGVSPDVNLGDVLVGDRKLGVLDNCPIPGGGKSLAKEFDVGESAKEAELPKYSRGLVDVNGGKLGLVGISGDGKLAIDEKNDWLSAEANCRWTPDFGVTEVGRSLVTVYEEKEAV
ncbi:MAG: hypothetical protein RLZ12_472, partial [Bacillota bacterium]